LTLICDVFIFEVNFATSIGAKYPTKIKKQISGVENGESKRKGAGS
jgi:hypothetical protein